MTICWEKAVPLAFHLCCFYFSAVLIVSLSRLMFKAGCGIRLYRFLITAFSSALQRISQRSKCNVIIISQSRCTLSDDVNIQLVDLSGTINTLSNALNWLEKMQLFQTNIFFNLLSVILGTHPWPLSVLPKG